MSGQPDRVSVAVGAGAMRDDSIVLELGSDHPSTHGGMRLDLRLDGGRIVSADPRIGFVHRGAEKLFEVRDYRQILMLANRHDWLSSFAGELGVVLAVERLMGVTVPERAVWLRTALAEINRASAGLAFLGTVPDGYGGSAIRTTKAREALLGVLEEFTGGRVHVMVNRIGGLATDLPLGWLDRTRTVLDRLATELPELVPQLLGHRGVQTAAGLGPIPADLVDAYGLTGPLARASGSTLDLRRDEPYLAYGELDVAPAVRSEGDVVARLACLGDDVTQALQLARTCLDRLPAGPIGVRLPKAVRPPEGETYVWTENPLGIGGVHLVSRGDITPWRLKLRTPSFATLSALPAVLPGLAVQDLPLVLASLFFVLGDADR